MTDQKEENNMYDIFYRIKTNHDYENNDNIEVGSNNSNKRCDTVKWTINGYNEKLNNLCKEFINLYNVLYPPNMDKNGNTSNKHAAYLNFWFNNKLRSIDKKLTDEESIYSSLNNICNTIDTSNIIKNKIYKIPEEHYDKLDMLNNLYTNYIKLETTEDVQLDEKSYYTNNAKICIKIFAEVIKLYHQKINYNFYKALRKFSVLYKIAKYKLAFFKKIEVDPLPVLETEIAKKKLEDACNSFVTDTLDRTPGINNTHENILKDFLEYKKYNEFYKHTNGRSICVKYYDKIIHLENKNKDIITKICTELAANLEKLSSMTSISANHRERCSYMNYWTYNIIMQTLKSISDNKEKINLLNIINNLLFDINDKLPKEKMKRKIYTTILGTTQKTDYCKYITYINSLYEKYVHSCCTYFYNNAYWNGCIAYFNCEEYYNPYNLYLKLNCQEISTDKNIQKSNYSSSHRLYSYITI
ncbi:CYIR protein [Plasmodium cynomolgi strain B]|uniref:CYIR protein n=1 Tax=Plasmodium cynomolgi (strain B) TaxID=1120755 RepID=K6UF26_PLACD|nr:CYIR protein [Plasmodium cynomolgi strain B]GAB69366.1 CYIR protein [Plasmodium cynomolgi strain B]